MHCSNVGLPESPDKSTSFQHNDTQYGERQRDTEGRACTNADTATDKEDRVTARVRERERENENDNDNLNENENEHVCVCARVSVFSNLRSRSVDMNDITGEPHAWMIALRVESAPALKS